MIKSTRCSSRGSGFGSQHPHMASVQRHLTPLSGSTESRHAHGTQAYIHVGETHMSVKLYVYDSGAEEMISWVKRLLCRHEDLGL